MAVLSLVESVRKALEEEMQADPSVIILGEDVGVHGGVFRATDGLVKQFGENRVIDTPLAELGIAGVAFGAGVNGGLYHSQSVEALFFHVPGLKIVIPSTPYDCKGLLKSSIRDDDPVLFFEHKKSYRRLRGEVPDEDYVVPLGKADIKRAGRDLSIITYGIGVHLALEASAQLASEGIDVEILDLRTLLPMDTDAIKDSVAKTSKVLILHEDNKTGGIGAEVAALIAEECFEELDGPIVRLAAADTHIPYAPALEEAILPNADDVFIAARRLAEY